MTKICDFTNEELANAIVSSGIGNKYPIANTTVYCFPASSDVFQNAEEFVNDWRVCGVLLEKCRGPDNFHGAARWINLTQDICHIPLRENLCRTIIVLCLEILWHE